MGLFEQFPYTNYHELNLQWILSITKELDDKVGKTFDDVERITKETAIAWLVENADTFSKYNVPVYNVTDYGVQPGSGDIYVAMHDFIRDYASVTGGVIYMPAGYYETSYTIFIPENCILIGAGDATVLYWTEYNTWYGCALATAGNNVKICNLRVEQKTQGIFPAGAQPGCIGISSSPKANALLPAYSHDFVDGDVHNITIENITSTAAMYVLQVECGRSEIANVTVKNIQCPVGTVSVGGSQAGGSLKNLRYENIECSLFRTHVYNTAKAADCIFDNVVCESMRLDIMLGENITYKNIKMTNGARHNTVVDSRSMCYLRGNATFINCTLVGSSESGYYGLQTLQGFRTWIGCTITSVNKLLSRDSGTFEDNNENMYGCTLTCSTSAGTSLLVGYGASNKVTGAVDRYLIGDGDVWRNMPDTVTGVHQNTLIYKGDTLYLSSRMSMTNGAPNGFPATFRALPLSERAVYPIILTSGASRVPTTCKFVSGAFTMADNSVNPANYSELSIHSPIFTERLTPAQLYTVFNG